MIAVRVKYARTTISGSSGWAYTVLAADSLTWLGEGWSLGRRSNCVAEFRRAAQRNGWTERDLRADRMRATA